MNVKINHFLFSDCEILVTWFMNSLIQDVIEAHFVFEHFSGLDEQGADVLSGSQRTHCGLIGFVLIRFQCRY